MARVTKCYFASRADTDLAEEDATLREAVRCSLLARGLAEEAGTPEAAEAIILHEASWFKERRYVARLRSDPLAGKFSHRIYTINSDDSAPGLLRGLYTSLPRQRFDRARHRAVPYTYFPNETVVARRDEPRTPPPYLATWRGNTKSNPRLRGGLRRVLGNAPGFLIETTDSWLNHDADEKRRYVDLLRAGRFSLCPGGWAAVSLRIYESMALGVCPVIVADGFVPPDGPDWSACSVRVRERDLVRLPVILAGLSDAYQRLGSAARAAWEKFFRLDTMADYYADALLACIASAPPTASAAGERRRWGSLRTAWLNHWTLPQRAANKLRRLARR